MEPTIHEHTSTGMHKTSAASSFEPADDSGYKVGAGRAVFKPVSAHLTYGTPRTPPTSPRTPPTSPIDSDYKVVAGRSAYKTAILDEPDTGVSYKYDPKRSYKTSAGGDGPDLSTSSYKYSSKRSYKDDIDEPSRGSSYKLSHSYKASDELDKPDIGSSYKYSSKRAYKSSDLDEPDLGSSYKVSSRRSYATSDDMDEPDYGSYKVGSTRSYKSSTGKSRTPGEDSSSSYSTSRRSYKTGAESGYRPLAGRSYKSSMESSFEPTSTLSYKKSTGRSYDRNLGTSTQSPNRRWLRSMSERPSSKRKPQ